MKQLAYLLSSISIVIFVFHSCSEHDKEQPPPNIICLFSDDHAVQAVGAYGGRLQSINPTPNLDRLADEGLRYREKRSSE